VRPFTYRRAATFTEAAELLGDPDTQALGGGTDLLVLLEEGLASPTTLVDLRSVRDSDTITALPDGGFRIAAGTRLHDVARHPEIREGFAALAEACDVVGSPALRNMGTIGGNLCQRPRCWYFRRGIPCLKSGGAGCPAFEGENQYHAILDGGPCYIVHPSDPAVALTALDADIEIVGPDGTSIVPITRFFTLPRDRLDSETVLRAGEIVSAIILPGAFSGGVQLYRKLMQRGAWDFALVSLAAARRRDGAVRIALGGVAPRPWRVPESVEEDVASGGLDEDSIAALAERALYDARPLSKNGYKIALAASLLRDAMREIAA
jgi:xanthine dehydrogenase YagS FAD-binding subunit